MKILVTGGAGFIGNRVLRELLGLGYEVINVDSLTETASLSSVWDLQEEPGYTLEYQDIGDSAALSELFKKHTPSAVMHLAAETDRSRALRAPSGAVSTNVMGTFNLLETARLYWEEGGAPNDFRVLMASSASVFGGPTQQAAFEADAPQQPSDPQGATFAAAEHMTRAWYMSFGFPVLTCRGTNTYGPWQHPGALIPLTLARAMSGESIPFQDDDDTSTEWLHVSDHARALVAALEFGRPGSVYNIGADVEMRNVDLVRALCRLLQVKRPSEVPYSSLLSSAKEDLVSERTVKLDDRKFRSEIGWSPEVSFEKGLADTLDWYLSHASWWQPLLEQRTQRDKDHQPLRRAAGGGVS